MNPFVSALVLLAGLTPTAGASAGGHQVAATPRLVQNTVSQPVAAAGAAVASGDRFVGAPFVPDQAQENVLVIPTPNLPPESLTDLTEDLTVMCRIFDKAVPVTRAVGAFAYGDRSDVFRYALGQRSAGTQGLYLDGYGALFFVHIDYPLAPTEQQEQPQAKATEPTDSVWSQTVKEMSGQPADEPQPARNAQTYDAQKVENLKKALIKTLAHASNIRTRRPQDVITLVAGALDEGGSWGPWGRLRVRVDPKGSWGRPGQPGPDRPQTTARPPTAALLILRVTKAEVDAVARKQLTLDQFTEKVQVLFSPSVSSTPAASATGPTPVGSRR